MKLIGLFIGFLALVIFVLPPLTAQDEKKKDADKAEKKDPEAKDEKKDSEKKDEKKDAEKKDPEKKDSEKKEDEKKKSETKKEKLVYGQKIMTKVMSAGSGDSNSEITVEQKEIDPKKVYELQTWKSQQMFNLQKEQLNISTQKDPRQRAIQNMSYQRNLANYQMDLAKRQGNIYNTKPWDIKAAENVKVRSMFPPVEFDDQGFQKKWTKKELEERKDKTGLPGYPVDLDAIKAGQTVEIYMAKVEAKKKDKDAPMKKKNADDDPPPAMERPEFVMIVIWQDVTPGK